MLHLQNVLKVLIKNGADIHKELSAGKQKNTPLMMAAYRGELEMVKLLVKNTGKVEQGGVYDICIVVLPSICTK